ncbi:MAG: sensor histidine kinase, partial [Solirubrobacterales bacterium]|nr:sensor histidine kinase [Solirubrobacterales bacterium]
EHGGGRIEVRARALGDRVRVEVADGGPGLPAPVADVVRGPRAGRGTRGRGLAIASGILARHGGRLTAEGGSVVLELPAAAPEPVLAAPAARAAVLEPVVLPRATTPTAA